MLEAVGASVARAPQSHRRRAVERRKTRRGRSGISCAAASKLAIRSGATTINIPDTVGYSTPQEYLEMITMLRDRVPGSDKVVFSTHCHNDLGLAVANSLAGVLAGARQVECTINGIGERAGNAALEEIVMALKVRRDVMPSRPASTRRMLSRASKLVSNVTGFPVQYNKAIVGKNAFAQKSGIHQDGMLKNVETYEIMRPEDVGVKETSLVLGKLSGRHAFRDKLEGLGYALDDQASKRRSGGSRNWPTRRSSIRRRYRGARGRRSRPRPRPHRRQGVESGDGLGRRARAELTLRHGRRRRAATAQPATGRSMPSSGPFVKLYPHTASLQLFQVHAVTEGTDAQANVSVRLEENGRTVTGRAADTDTLVAAANAYVNALNRLLVKREKQAPEALSVAR